MTPGEVAGCSLGPAAEGKGALIHCRGQCRAPKALPLDSGKGLPGPCTPGLRRPAPRPLANRPPVGYRQRPAALDRQSGSLAPRPPSVGTAASRHPRPPPCRTGPGIPPPGSAPSSGDAWRNSATPPPSSPAPLASPLSPPPPTGQAKNYWTSAPATSRTIRGAAAS